MNTRSCFQYLSLCSLSVGLLMGCGSDPQSNTANEINPDKVEKVIEQNIAGKAVEAEVQIVDDQIVSSSSDNDMKEEPIKEEPVKEEVTKPKKEKIVEEPKTERKKKKKRSPKVVKTEAPVAKKVVAKTEPIDPDDPYANLKDTKIRFETDAFDFGFIDQGKVINKKFVFFNTGTENLVIKNVTATCGCTKPSYPFMPIEPGDKGFIEVQFDSHGRLGNQQPEISVFANTREKLHKLKLKGVVTDGADKKVDSTTSKK